MTVEERYAIWAPAESVWSQWVAPVFFAQIDYGEATRTIHTPELDGLKLSERKIAIVVDINGAPVIEFGMALAQKGFRPVLILNASPGPHMILRLTDGPTNFMNAAINMGPLVDIVCDATPMLQNLRLLADAPPVFLLDAYRLTGSQFVTDRLFDNRWMVFPQDFPSANFLKSQGIEEVVLIQQHRMLPQDDLAHVLLRWQESGIPILATTLSDRNPPQKIVIQRPSRFKAAWYRALAVLGLRRNKAGGFGGYIPEITGAG